MAECIHQRAGTDGWMECHGREKIRGQKGPVLRCPYGDKPNKIAKYACPKFDADTGDAPDPNEKWRNYEADIMRDPAMHK